MTPTEWKTCDRVLVLLDAIPANVRTHELLSFACAVCNNLKHLLRRESLDALQVLEQYLAGNATQDQIQAARETATVARRRSAVRLTFKPVKIHPPERAAMIVETALSLEAWKAAREAAIAFEDLNGGNAANLLREYIDSWPIGVGA